MFYSVYKGQSYSITGLDRPLEFQEVETPRIYIKSAHGGCKVVSPKHRPPLPPPKRYTWHSFLLDAESNPGPYRGHKDEVNEEFQ